MHQSAQLQKPEPLRSFKVNPFVLLHRSIFDPLVYVEALQASTFALFRYVIFLVMLFSVIASIAHVVYCLHPVKGAAPIIARMFDGAQIKEGRFVPSKPAPYVVSSTVIQELLSAVYGLATTGRTFPDSFLVVDTGNVISVGANSQIPFIFTRDSLVANMGGGVHLRYAYTQLFNGLTEVNFDEATIQQQLQSRLLVLFVSFLMVDGFSGFLNFFTSLLLLTLSAFFLIPGGQHRWGRSFRPAALSLSALAVGLSIEVASGTHVPGIWYIFMVVSSIILVRGVRVSQIPPPMSSSDSEKPH